MERRYLEQMMADYNQIKKYKEEAYLEVFQKLNLRRFPKNTIIKQINKVDEKSRYICEGFVGLYKEYDKGFRLSLISGPSDTAFDEQSFRSKKASNNILKTLSATVLLEFSIDAESALLAKVPEFALLALEVSHRINERNFEQMLIKDLKFEEGYPKLTALFPGIDKYIKNYELADYFKCSISTVERGKRNLKKGGGHE